MKVKKTLMDMIVKWHQAGYSLDEITPLVPQVPKEITRNPTVWPGSWHHHKPDYTRRRESNK